MNIPPPEQRLCVKHGKPICPSFWKAGCRTTGCSKCTRERGRSPKARQRREEKWDNGDIRCKKHPERRAHRSFYVCCGGRKCNWCNTHRADGTSKPGRKRSNIRSSNKQHYRKSMILRNRFGGRIRGIKLFERATGILVSMRGTVE
jgi:hypothetical protein